MSLIVAVQEGNDTIVASGPQFGVKYTLVSPDGSRAVFNDPGDPDYVGHISDMTGMDSPDVREAADDLIGDDGGVHGEFFYGRRPITMTGLIDNRPATHHYAVTKNALIARNLARHSSFENGSLNGWTNTMAGFGAIETLAVSTVWRDQGSRSLRYAATKDNNTTTRQMGVISPTGTSGYPAEENTSYTVRATVNVTDQVNATGIRLRLSCYSSSGALLSTINGAYSTGTGVKELSLVADTPAGTSYVAVALSGDSATAIERHEFYVDSVQVVRTDQDPGYYFGAETLAGGVPLATDAFPDGSSGLFTSERKNFSASHVRNLRMTKLARVTNATRRDMSMRWQPDGGVEQTISVRRQQPLRFTGAFNKEFQLALVSADHRIYAVTTKEKDINPGGSTDIVENEGTAATPANVVLYGPAVNPVVRNFTTGEIVSLTYTLLPGDFITMDFRNRTVFLNNTTNIYSAVNFASSVWWQLQPGRNNVRWSATGTTAASKMRVQWQDAWV